MVAEVLSESDPDRDLVTKRLEYARAGIPHYWIVDPDHKSIVTLEIVGDRYEVAGRFGADDVVTSGLFPGLRVPVRRFFR